MFSHYYGGVFLACGPDCMCDVFQVAAHLQKLLGSFVQKCIAINEGFVLKVLVGINLESGIL